MKCFQCIAECSQSSPKAIKAKRIRFIGLLKERLVTADMSQVKNDVLPFVKDVNELDIWSNDYFVQLADRMKIE